MMIEIIIYIIFSLICIICLYHTYTSTLETPSVSNLGERAEALSPTFSNKVENFPGTENFDNIPLVSNPNTLSDSEATINLGTISKKLMEGNLTIPGNVNINYDVIINGKVTISKDVIINGTLTVKGTDIVGKLDSYVKINKPSQIINNNKPLYLTNSVVVNENNIISDNDTAKNTRWEITKPK
jgi:hypothetical protein